MTTPQHISGEEWRQRTSKVIWDTASAYVESERAKFTAQRDHARDVAAALESDGARVQGALALTSEALSDALRALNEIGDYLYPDYTERLESDFLFEELPGAVGVALAERDAARAELARVTEGVTELAASMDLTGDAIWPHELLALPTPSEES